ncbi:MAG TPA: L-2-hydroxyglutarate oxidase [Thermoplasmata archaeon]|nr:L-2-hydroxyglutarate oxidase [Thermoplasmata archaeon]
MDGRADVLVVGGGIVGLATARELLAQRPGTRVLLVEKEDGVARHQTGHNSGVIHSGVYYKPGSLKATLCVRGRRLLLEYVAQHQIAYELCGKVIVANGPEETARLEELGRRAKANGVPDTRMMDRDGLRAIEPAVRGERALLVPGTGIVDYKEVSRQLAADLTAAGADLRTGTEVRGIRTGAASVEVETNQGPLSARYLVNAAGLQSDRIAREAGLEPGVRILPFRGEYYFLRRERRDLFHGLVYPVPDPAMPFLGVHFTRTIHGEIEAGPNAILAFSREGYRKSDIDLGDLAEAVFYPGFLRMLQRYRGAAFHETNRSFRRAVFLRDLQQLAPELTDADIAPGGSGVRAQAVFPDGRMADDFLLLDSPRGLHILNAPSPAATSSLAIAEQLVERIPKSFAS